MQNWRCRRSALQRRKKEFLTEILCLSHAPAAADAKAKQDQDKVQGAGGREGEEEEGGTLNLRFKSFLVVFLELVCYRIKLFFSFLVKIYLSR